MQKAKSIALILGVLAMSILVGYFVLAWTEPTAPPPGGNVPAPLNVGNVGQTKAGGLILNTGGASTGLIVRYGNVGIGTTGPAQKLDINGQIRIRGGNPAAGRVLTATGADGIATWQTPVSAGAPVGASYVVMALDGTLTAERRLTAGTGITISDAGANSNVTVGLSYPSKSCGSGSAIQSFNVGSSANPTCVAVGGGGCSNVFNGIYADGGSIISASGCSSKFYIRGENGISTRTSGNQIYVSGSGVGPASWTCTTVKTSCTYTNEAFAGCPSGYRLISGSCTVSTASNCSLPDKQVSISPFRMGQYSGGWDCKFGRKAYMIAEAYCCK